MTEVQGVVQLLVANAAFVGVFVFTVGCLASGLMFAGFDAQPADKVATSVINIQKWCGIALFISGSLVLLGSSLDAGPDTGISLWFGTILCFFGFLWLVLSDTLAKGGDFKPVGVMLAFAGVVLAAYAFTAAKVIDVYQLPFFGYGKEVHGMPAWGTGMFGDAFILFVMASVACLGAFVAIRFVPALLKWVGWIFFLIGLWATYMSVRYIYELCMGGIGAGMPLV